MVTSQIQNLIDSTVNKATSGPNQVLGKDDFLKLLMTQLKYQDFNNVNDDKEFIAQLAQFSSLEQTKQMADNFGALIQFQQLAQATGLIEREVELKGGTDGENIKGKVDEVRLIKGVPKLIVDGKEYTVDDIVSIKPLLVYYK